MASLRAVAQRRAEIMARLTQAKEQIAKRFGVKVKEQPITNQDAELARVQELENIAGLLEAILGAEPTELEPEPVIETSEDIPSDDSENTLITEGLEQGTEDSQEEADEEAENVSSEGESSEEIEAEPAEKSTPKPKRKPGPKPKK